MDGRQEGWPLGLQPLNMIRRDREISGSVSRDREISGSVSCTTFPTSSHTSCSSDLDTQSTGSFFHDRSITLGSLMGISTILDLSRGGTQETSTTRNIKCKSKPWLFSLCSKLDTNDVIAMNTNSSSSLAYFLEQERRSVSIPNSLFIGGEIAPPRIKHHAHNNDDGDDEHVDEYRVAIPCSCLCGQLTH